MIDPQTQELLKELKEKNLLADVKDTPVEARKRLYDRLYMIASDKQEVSSVKDMEIDGKHGNFKVRVYRPAGSKPEEVLPVLIYYHGGGWVIGSIDTVDSVCRQISNESGACVISVDYHLAPEWKFPAAVG